MPACRHRSVRGSRRVPAGAAVNLALVKLPDNAVMFANPPTKRAAFSLTSPRSPHNVTKEFIRKATGLQGPCATSGAHTHRSCSMPTCRSTSWPPAAVITGGAAEVLREETRKADAAAVIGALNAGRAGKPSD
jgi:hypothetical protein